MSISHLQLRQQLRQLRRAIPDELRHHHAQAMAGHLTNTRLFRRSLRIAAYLATDGEIDPLPVLQKAWHQNKRVYLPVLIPYRGNRLWFAPYHPDSRLKANRYGILEPRVSRRELIAPQALDLVLTPLVGFDLQGNRLGMGGGYYDRSFSFLHRRSHWQRPRFMGLAFELQCVEQLPGHPWDVPLYGIATEQGVHITAD